MLRPYAECDIECYPDWFLVKFYTSQGMFSVEQHDGKRLNLEAIQWFIDNYTLVTFNGDNYDMNMLALAMTGATCHELKQANDAIIVGGLKRWDFTRAYGIEMPRNLDHIDIMEVAPGVRVSLKAYMGRMHSETIQDLPYSPSEPTTPEMRQFLDLYCGNDLIGTRELRETVKERLELRMEMSADYGIDLRSKSDAQMSEAIVKSQLGFYPDKRYVPHGFKFQYEPPEFIKFSTPVLQQLLQTVRNAWFTVNDVDEIRRHKGAPEGEEMVDDQGKKIKTGVVIPPELKTLIRIGSSAYQFGIGGLHSTEKVQQCHTVIGKQTVSDHDVRSYYPSLYLLLKMFPGQLGPRWLEIMQKEYDERQAAKDAGKKTKANGKKIVLNGAFGKLFSKYSVMFAPELGIRITITGQLCMLMLIEMLERSGIRVASANTDGLVLVTPVGLEWLRDSTIKYWESVTGLETEANFYKSLYSRDVNNYVAIMTDGTVKAKGTFAESGVLSGSAGAHPDKDICADAVIDYLSKGVRIDKTIRECRNLRKFVFVRAVKGGGKYRERYLGKTIRGYYAKGCQDDAIYYVNNGNKVGGSSGSKECMRLPKEFPEDVDYDHYIADAIKMLTTIGVQYA